MTDRPIIFSAPMIRALLAGTKTQTRRLFRPPLPFAPDDDISVEVATGSIAPRQQPGDRLWVKEAHALVPATAYRMSEGAQQVINPVDPDEACVYRCGWERSAPSWRSPIHMPRWASRITLHVEDVRVQRVQEISAGDCYAEGCFRPDMTRALGSVATARSNARNEFAKIWNSIHGPDAWRRNPWVCAITFRVIRANIDAPEAGAGNEARRE